MSFSRADHAELEREMEALKAQGVAFAMATIVRTVNATSAKPGAKALIDAHGTIVKGWIGGGCARGAVGKAAKEAIETGAPQYVSLRPQELLETEGLKPGEQRDGVRFARNGCPSEGTMDVFVEPVLPLPELVICGGGLVAEALADLAARFDFSVVRCGADSAASECAIETEGYVVVATQGQGDLEALGVALGSGACYVSFVGSHKKFQALSRKLVSADPALTAKIKDVRAPAGLDIAAITPAEIALSILGEITQTRRSKIAQRQVAHA